MPAVGRERVPTQALRLDVLPGEIYGSQKAAYIERAQYWYDRMGDAAKPSSTPTAPSKTPDASVDVDALARDVIAGKYGNGDARRKALGTSYAAVQARVNEILGGGGKAATVDIDALARAVIRGDYGNGEERKRRLGANYAAVQARVNELLS